MGWDEAKAVGGGWAMDLGFLTLVVGLTNVSVGFVLPPVSPAPHALDRFDFPASRCSAIVMVKAM